MADDPARFSAAATPLLQELIRNACVNDGTPGSGQEARNVDTLAAALDGPGIEMSRYEPEPGRDNLVARIDGRDPEAPTLVLHAHTDVVPADASRWTHDPFGGELVDGRVWGRGAIDMLNHAATAAVTLRALADEGWTPEGTLVFAATADDANYSRLGTEWLAERHPDVLRGDYVVTTTGGIPGPGPHGPWLPVVVGQKGANWVDVVVTGAPVRPMLPLQDNALATAAEVVGRLDRFRPPCRVTDLWRAFLVGSGWDESMAAMLDPQLIDEAVELVPTALQTGIRTFTSDTLCPIALSPGSIEGDPPGTPTVVTVTVDVRTLPAEDDDPVALVAAALGDLADDVEITLRRQIPASQSPVETPLWDALDAQAKRWYPKGTLVPWLPPGTTDARVFRDLGATAYGFALFSEQFTIDDLVRGLHGDDEWCDVESLGLTAALWYGLARDLLGG